MELDKRIKEGKRPLTCFDTEQAKEFLGKECYFSNCKVHYKNLSAFEKYVTLTDYCIGTLTAIMDLGDRVFDVDQECKEFSYCLPCEWVKPEEPKKTYRPYSLEEFTENHFYADSIIFRRQDSENNTEEHSMYLGYETAPDLITDAPGNGTVLIGNRRYRLQDLYDYYEIFEDDKWQPFGIEVKEKE